ncbi:paired amphipathic helix protein Sin3-like 3 isoform X2 [Elaeis guineensis]|uniref:Paired amphipathic helix protein Sin3-like 3 n=1 Tax=Elaeis guineensis var. tenera TaxID=51953 RepID=A0A6I9S2R7_ELAGV|nr:paired amphipathic helix protein Sin3-like 3 [Elaeis guineensis]
MPICSSTKTSEKACSTSHTSAANNINIRATTDDALNYLQLVKDAFYDEPAKYETFLDIMKEFRSHRIDTATVATRVKHLFSGHPELIQGFNFFLPTEHQIPIYVREAVAHHADQVN